MNVDVSFQFAKVYNIDTFDVVKGQKFSLFTDYAGSSRWLSENDPVLALLVTGNNADVEAVTVGTSVILIMDDNYQALKKLTIRVVDAIVEPVKDLGLTAEPPVFK